MTEHTQTNVRTMHFPDGSTEIQWGRGDDDEAISGYIIVHPDGTATFPHGDGFVIYLDGKDTRIVSGEEGYTKGLNGDQEETVLWHSESQRIEQ